MPRKPVVGFKKRRRNIAPSQLQDLGIERSVETVAEEPPQIEKGVRKIYRKGERPANLALPQSPIHTGSEEDEQIMAASHPGELHKLGFGFWSWSNDTSIPTVPTVLPQQLFEIEIKKLDTLVVIDWRTYALKNIGGNLEVMFPGELDDSNFAITVRRGGGKGAGLGFYAYGPGLAAPAGNQFDQNAVGLLDAGSALTWPGRFRYIIRGPERLSVFIHYKAAALPPYAIPAVVASQIMGYYRFG
jgi:hypothetical protein